MSILELRSRSVGPWPMNTYALVCPETRQSALIDPGADPEALMRLLSGTTPTLIVLTHTHPDHVGALGEMRRRLGVPVLSRRGPYIRDVAPDQLVLHGERIAIGSGAVAVHETPGHTEDMICLAVEGGDDVIVGDTIFSGGPGRTWSTEGFQTTLRTLRQVVLAWPDTARCHPGHGEPFTLGDRRAEIEKFLSRDYGRFFGDATWRGPMA
ncbi:MBL fold metallo-hydrolase [Chloroflexia bacterium SDU3-3]|nr:MBL fold metallo-hydrolase [Chloroflexia bacterium SDU3-3]